MYIIVFNIYPIASFLRQSAYHHHSTTAFQMSDTIGLHEKAQVILQNTCAG